MCPHFLKGCGGCSYWNLNYTAELELKKQDLLSKLPSRSGPDIKILPAPGFNLRTRFDVTLKDQSLGLYSKDRELIDLDSCAVLHPELQKAFQYLRHFIKENPFPVKKGSLRLRLAADLKTWGLWLDLANTDIKALLEEKNLLMRLSEKFIIEIGQKKKRLDLKSFSLNQLKLTDPAPEKWFKTLDHELLCSISSFTQPTWETADLMTSEILNWLSRISSKHIIEYGCGIGQYTIPLAVKGYSLTLFESDETALNHLKLNLPLSSQKQVELNPSGLAREMETTALVNPPRSGLKEFTQSLIESSPEFIIYISCFPESLAQDLQTLSNHYQIKNITLIDQFARTKHYETAVLLQRV